MTFDKFACYCSETSSQVEASLADSRQKVPELQNSMRESNALLGEWKDQLKQHQSDADSITAALKDAKEIRAKEKHVFEQDSAELKSQIASLEKATGNLQQAETLQQGTGLLAWLQELANHGRADRFHNVDRHVLVSMLQGPAEAMSHRAQIVGILEQLMQDMSNDLSSMTDLEQQRESGFTQMEHTKKQEYDSLIATVNLKQSRVSAESLRVVQLGSDLSMTNELQSTGQEVDQELRKECDRRQQDYKRNRHSLKSMLNSLAEAIKIITGGLARALFGGTLVTSGSLAQTAPASVDTDQGEDGAAQEPQPSPVLSFMQVPSVAPMWSRDVVPERPLRMSQQEQQGVLQQSLKLVRGASVKPARKALLHQLVKRASTAARKPAAEFGKISTLVDQMLDILGRQQDEDDAKVKTCTEVLEREGAHITELQEDIAAAQADLATANTELDAATKDIQELRKSIQKLDRSVETATQNRKIIHGQFVTKAEDITKAIQAFREANNILSGISANFNKSRMLTGLQVTTDVDVADLVAANQSQASTSTAELAEAADNVVHSLLHGGIKGKREMVQAALLSQVSIDIREILTTIEKQLHFDFKQCQVEEKRDQAQYEILMHESASLRSKDVEAITRKSGTHADIQTTVLHLESKIHDCQVELEQTKVVVGDLHRECDELLKDYEKQRQARDIERSSLRKTQKVLQKVDVAPKE